jgi:hypothetical protein
MEELNEQSEEFSSDKLQSKGFFDELTIYDFLSGSSGISSYKM